jgi:hypothetical protein
MGIAVEGSTGSEFRAPALPQFDLFNQQRHYIDIFNRGTTPFDFMAKATVPWINLSATTGAVEKDTRLWVSVDWSKVVTGTSEGSIEIRGPKDSSIQVKATAFKPVQPSRDSLQGFVEANGYVSIEAVHFTNSVAGNNARWEVIPDLGRTLSSMSIFPVTAPTAIPLQDSPHLEYKMYLFDAGKLKVDVVLAPTQKFVPGRGLRYAISWDEQPPQIVDALEHNSLRDWEETVKDGVRRVTTELSNPEPGYHILKFWMVDPGVVLQRLVVDAGGVRPSYLGPPESYRSR